MKFRCPHQNEFHHGLNFRVIFLAHGKRHLPAVGFVPSRSDLPDRIFIVEITSIVDHRRACRIVGEIIHRGELHDLHAKLRRSFRETHYPGIRRANKRRFVRRVLTSTCHDNFFLEYWHLRRSLLSTHVTQLRYYVRAR